MAEQIKQEKILDVKNLRISFKTNGGTVKAVRGISFSLYRGRVLAIVGESGSGKSVTSKAILGILANNKIIEDGQIIFEGKDLLKLSEEQFTKIRGVKISMIFQDPLSSLNPIMKVGKQLTEAMVLKSRATRKEARRIVSRLDRCLKLYLGEEEAKVIFEDGKALTTIDQIDLEKNKASFLKATKQAVIKQSEALKDALKIANDYYSKHFENLDKIDLKLAKAEVKPLFKALNKAKLSMAVESDDTLEVFDEIMADYYSSYCESEKLIKQRNELLEKNNCKSVFDLQPSLRAKMREVIIPGNERLLHMQETLKNLIQHIQDLLNISDLAIEELAMKIEKVYFESVVEEKTNLSKGEAKARALELLKEVGIPEPERRYNQYPFEFSGGMRQRIVIAIALSSNPDVLICDEPTTALDVTIQAQILELINKLKVEKNLSIIFITHDLGVVANMADDIAVMYAGKIVEFGTVYDIFYDPRHPYTWALLGSMPDLKTKEKLNAIPGTPPNMLLPPKGDAFALRNKFALEEDFIEQPPYFAVSPTHYAATWLLHPSSPDVKVPEIVSKRISDSLSQSSENKPNPDSLKNSVLSYIGGLNK